MIASENGKHGIGFAAVFCLLGLLAHGAEAPGVPSGGKPVFREPFTLRLKVDKERYYEETFEGKIPYVAGRIRSCNWSLET